MKYSVYYPVFSTATFHVTVYRGKCGTVCLADTKVQSPLFLLNYSTVCDRKFDFFFFLIKHSTCLSLLPVLSAWLQRASHSLVQAERKGTRSQDLPQDQVL